MTTTSLGASLEAPEYEHYAECEDRWYECRDCHSVYRKGTSWYGRPNNCPDCGSLFGRTVQTCVCDVIDAERCDYCGGIGNCRCP